LGWRWVIGTLKANACIGFAEQYGTIYAYGSYGSYATKYELCKG
jgi:hypothetical protein